MVEADEFGQPRVDEHGQFLLDLDGYEGPIDLLLSLARDQKVDLSKISILALAEQYLAFVERARALKLELAADYLVMAAWLAYLKSRLLLPEPETPGEPTGAELAEALAFQLRRLEAMRLWGDRLMTRPRLGRDVFARGAPEPAAVNRKIVYELSLFALLAAYGLQHARKETRIYTIEPFTLHSVEDAIERLSSLLGHVPGWTVLSRFLPEGLRPEEGLVGRSALAATFGATLELAKRGIVEVRQESTFGPIYVRTAGERPQ